MTGNENSSGRTAEGGIGIRPGDINFSSNMPSGQDNSPQEAESVFQSPMDRSAERVTKKPFGIYVSPQNSPVSPEKFQGYHTAVDLEIFPEELDTDVPVRAICQGELLIKRSASGYGGVVVQSCLLDNQPITVVYGHLKLDSVAIKIGEKINPGDKIGILGADKSAETGGERKHLHLGIHKGKEVNILGYVQNENSLSGWINPCDYICH